MLRHDKITQVIKREISNIIHDELKDPRLGFVTITRVEMTADLRCAKVFFSVLGKEAERKKTKEALDSASGYIRRLIAQRIRLRFTPEIMFREDRSIEYGIQIETLLNKLEVTDEPKKGNRQHKKK
jgi:ribosome-binding factor A